MEPETPLKILHFEGQKATSQPVPARVRYRREVASQPTSPDALRPSVDQVREARAWLVRVIARRAVEIVKAQEREA